MDAAPGPETGDISPRARQLKAELLGEFSLTVDDVAGILEVDRSTIYRYIQDGALAALKLGREYRLSEVDVKGFLQALIEQERQRVAALRLRALGAEPPAAAQQAIRRPAPGGAPHPGERHTLFGRYSERSQKVITAAQAGAARRGASSVSTTDLLLALLADTPTGVGVARRALDELGVDVVALRRRVEANLPPPSRAPAPPQGAIAFSPAAKRVVMVHAVEAARRLGHAYVGTEHLLLGLYAGDHACRRLLVEAGAQPEAVEAETLRLLGATRVASPAPGPSDPGPALDAEAAAVLEATAAEAARRGHSVQRPAHLLLGLLAEQPGKHGGTARAVLERLGVEIDALRRAAEASLPPGRPDQAAAGGRLGSDLAAVVHGHAPAVARSAGATQVGAIHLLAALYTVPEVAELLQAAGAPEAAVRAEAGLEGGMPDTPQPSD
jgi:excisionase family DNA binding protein